MKKLKRCWNEASKPLRFVIHLLVIAVLVFSLYTYISAPTFTTEIQYRRVEKSNLIGPAQILGITERNFSDYDRFLLAEDEEGVVIYAESTENLVEPQLIYREKAGPVTILAAPDPTPFDDRDMDRSMTIFAFDSCPDAVSARLEFTLSARYRNSLFSSTYTLEAQRENPGYFTFTMHRFNREGIGAEGYAMQIFTLISGYGGRNFSDFFVPATIYFYDAQGTLLAQESTLVRSVEAQAHDPQ